MVNIRAEINKIEQKNKNSILKSYFFFFEKANLSNKSLAGWAGGKERRQKSLKLSVEKG